MIRRLCIVLCIPIVLCARNTIDTIINTDTIKAKRIYSGTHKPPGGEKRSDLHGGYYIGEAEDKFRGVQLLNQGSSAWVFLRERSHQGQSMLVTLQPNPLTVNAESIPHSNRVVARVNNFNNQYWSKDSLVQFNKKKYRIKKIIDKKTVALTRDNKKRSDFLFKKRIKDNLILPAFYFLIVADIKNNILKIKSGDSLPGFSRYDYRKERVSSFIDGKWYTLGSNGPERYTFKLKDAHKDVENIPVVIRLQPDYTIQFSLKRTSGQGLEETLSIMSSADGWRYKSSGSGVAIDKPHIFRVGNKDIFYIDKKKITSRRDLFVEGQGHFSDQVAIGEKKIIWKSGYGSPEGKISAPIGSLYSRTDGGANSTLYVKENDNGAYGWIAK